MKTENKQCKVGSILGFACALYLLCLSIQPLQAQTADSPLQRQTADSLLIFRYPARIQMFKADYKDNRATLRQFKSRLRTFQRRHDTLYVQSYSGEWQQPKADLRTAYHRANNLKGYLINTFGLRERHFKTTNHASPHPAWGEVVVVGFAPFAAALAESAAASPLPAEPQEQEQPQQQPQEQKQPQKQQELAATATTPEHPQPETPVAEVIATDNATTTDIATAPPRYFALKTNLAAWSGAILNLAADVQLTRHFSLELPVLWSPWHAGSSHAIKTFTIQPEARYWLAHPGEGHFFGIHAHVGWFNVKWDKDRYQDTDRPLLGAGISYGYLLPFNEHWAGEFTLGAGYANLRYDTYYNIDNGARIDTRTKNYWGITRVGISVVYRFNLQK